MPSKLLAAALLSASAALAPMPAHLAAVETQNDAAADAPARDLLAEGVQEFRLGRYQAAAKAFGDALKLNPEDRILYYWYLAAGDALVVQMRAYDELDEVLRETLRRARIYQTSLRHDPAYIAQMVGKLAGSDQERLVASLELIAIGPAAVPQLLAQLGGEREGELRAQARVVLTRMGGRAVLPLAEALRSDDRRLQAGIATVLADIGDSRALPRLVVAAADPTIDGTTRAVLMRAAAEIRSAAGVSPSTGPDELFFAEAQRYFRGGERVQDEMEAADALVWRWQAGEGDPVKRLAAVRVPRWAWNEAVAEQMVFDGLSLAPTAAAYQPLLAAILAAQLAEVEERRAAVGGPASGSDDRPEVLAAYADRLANQILRLRLAGAHLYGAVAEALAAERSAAAVLLLRQLEDRALARAEQLLPAPGERAESKPGAVLAAALAHDDKRVRYQAAITLACLDPAVPVMGAEQVVPVLAEAVAESGPRAVLVVEPDWRYRNAAREQLQAKGYVVGTATDVTDALRRLNGTAAVDALIVAAGAAREPDAPVRALLADSRLAGVPLLVARPEDPAVAAALEKAVDGKVAGLVAKPYAAIDLDAALKAALPAQPGDAARAQAEDLAQRASAALQRPDPRRTQFDLARAAAALAATLEHRSDAVRIAALGALANVAAARGGDAARSEAQRLVDVYVAQDAVLKPELRVALLRAMGALDTVGEAAQGIYAAALGHADPAVREAAAEAVGRLRGLPPDVLARLQAARRPDLGQPAAPAP